MNHIDHSSLTDRELLLLTNQAVEELKREIKELKDEMSDKFATKEQLRTLELKMKPYILWVQGLIALISITVGGAILSMIINKNL